MQVEVVEPARGDRAILNAPVPAVVKGLLDRAPHVGGIFADAEIVDWLFRDDESLPGTPIQALRENRGSEVKRRAQVAGY